MFPLMQAMHFFDAVEKIPATLMAIYTPELAS
jgi:hypothetical protein